MNLRGYFIKQIFFFILQGTGTINKIPTHHIALIYLGNHSVVCEDSSCAFQRAVTPPYKLTSLEVSAIIIDHARLWHDDRVGSLCQDIPCETTESFRRTGVKGEVVQHEDDVLLR